MKQLLDFLPLLIFFAFYKFQDIYWATGSLIVATGIQTVYQYWRYKKVDKTLLITFALVLVFGSLTLWLRSDVFIKWKVTIVYALFAAALLVSQYVMHKPLIQQMLGKELTLPDPIWGRVNAGWALFFLLSGLVNIYVAFWLPQETWVNFKVFGLTGLTLAASLLTGLYLYRHLPQDVQAGAPQDID